MNTLRVANRKERQLFEETLKGDLNKIPNVNSKLYGYQVFQPLVPNNEHNNQYGSPYHNSNVNNLNDIPLNNSKFDLGNNQQQKYYSQNVNYDQSINDNKFINNHNTQNYIVTPNNQNEQSYNINSNNHNQVQNQYQTQNMYNTNHQTHIPERNQNFKSVRKTKRDHIWEAKKQKYQQTFNANLPLSTEIPGKKIIDKMKTIKHEVVRTITPNNLDNYSNVRNNIYSGASSNEIKKTPLNNNTIKGFNNLNNVDNQNLESTGYSNYNNSLNRNNHNIDQSNYGNISNTERNHISNNGFYGSNNVNVYDYKSDSKGNNTSRTPFNKENISFDEQTLKKYNNSLGTENGQYIKYNNYNSSNNNNYSPYGNVQYQNNSNNSSKINGIIKDNKQYDIKGNFQTTYNNSYKFNNQNEGSSPYSIQYNSYNNQQMNNNYNNTNNNGNNYSKPFNNSVKFY